MAFRLANVDLLPTFLRSLQQTLLSKHDGSMIVMDETYDLEFGDDIKEDVEKRNLLVEPKIAAELGFQMQLYKASDSPMAGVLGFCKSNFEDPESAEDKIWTRVRIPLVMMKMHNTELKRSLRERKIHIGLTSAFI